MYKLSRARKELLLFVKSQIVRQGSLICVVRASLEWYSSDKSQGVCGPISPQD